MTPKEYRDQYAKKQGYVDWVDLQYKSNYCKRRSHTDEVMKAYTFACMPVKYDLDGPNTMPWSMRQGWNECIDQIKKNIG